MTSTKQKIRITVISDVICPWCWIGKKKLEQAMQLCKDKYDFQLRCEPYLLKPNTPPEGESKPELPPGKPRLVYNSYTEIATSLFRLAKIKYCSNHADTINSEHIKMAHLSVTNPETPKT